MRYNYKDSIIHAIYASIHYKRFKKDDYFYINIS